MNLATPEITRYGYDLVGNLIRQDNPNGVITAYQYDSLNRLDTLTHYRGVGPAPANDTDLTDNPKLAEFDYTVIANGQRTALAEKFWIDDDATADVVNDYQWTYDNLDRLTDEVFSTNLDDILSGDITQAEAIGLAAPGSLTGANRPAADYHDHYRFDLAGNRLLKTTDLGYNTTIDTRTISTYDVNDRLLREALDTNADFSVDRTTLYGYDHTQQTQKTVAVGDFANLADVDPNARLSSTQFAFDAQGRLAQATITTYNGAISTIERTTYDYDAAGIRVSALAETLDPANPTTVQSTVFTQYLNDPQNFTGYSQVLRETHTTETGAVQRVITYTFGYDEITQTTQTYGTTGAVQETRTDVFAHDGHGSVRALLNVTGAIATIAGVRQLFHYDAYGNALGFNMPTAATTLLYSGEQFDQRLLMQYLKARFYEATSARFVGLDAYFGNLSNPQSLNKYAYVHNNPILGVDPSGNEFSLGGMFAGSQIGAALNKINGNAALFTFNSATSDIESLEDFAWLSASFAFEHFFPSIYDFINTASEAAHATVAVLIKLGLIGVDRIEDVDASGAIIGGGSVSSGPGGPSSAAVTSVAAPSPVPAPPSPRPIYSGPRPRFPSPSAFFTPGTAWNIILGAMYEGILARLIYANGNHMIPDGGWGHHPSGHGADIVSVDRYGNVYLWDSKARSHYLGDKKSRTFTDSGRRRNAIKQAIEVIDRDSTLDRSLKTTALANLRSGTARFRTVWFRVGISGRRLVKGI